MVTLRFFEGFCGNCELLDEQLNRNSDKQIRSLGERSGLEIKLWDMSTWIWYSKLQSLIQFSHSVVSDSFWPRGLQHARPPCPSPSPRVCLNSCPLNRWCHPAISFSVIPFSSCPESLPESGSFLMSQFFASGDQSIGASASASVLPKHILGWFPLGLTYLIPLPSKGLSRGFYSTLVQKASIFQHSAFFMVQFSHPHMTTEKNHSFDYLDPCWQVDISAF